MSRLIGSEMKYVVGNAMLSCASFSDATYSINASWKSRSSEWWTRCSQGVSRIRSNPNASRFHS